MITDVFIKRYPEKLIHQETVPPSIGKLFAQATQIIFEDVVRYLADAEDFFIHIHNQLARELGHELFVVDLEEEIAEFYDPNSTPVLSCPQTVKIPACTRL